MNASTTTTTSVPSVLANASVLTNSELESLPAYIDDPLSLLPRALGAHAVLMTLLIVVVLPLGYGLGVRSRGGASHRCVQALALVLCAIGVALALSAHSRDGHVSSARDRSHQREHVHSDAHALIGLLALVALVLQTLLGCARAFNSRQLSEQATLARAMHRAMALVLVPLLVHQLLSGITSAFQLIEIGGSIEQCVVHFGSAALLYSLAALAIRTARLERLRPASCSPNDGYRSLSRSRVRLLGESALMFALGCFFALYSVYIEWPLSSSLNLTLSLYLIFFGGGGLLRLARLHHADAPPSWLVRGLATSGVASLAIGVTLIVAHRDSSHFQARLYSGVGALLIVASIARALLWWRALALALCCAATLLCASQRGAELLYSSRYSASLDIDSLLAALLFGSFALWLLAIGYDLVFCRVTRATTEKSEIREQELRSEVEQVAQEDPFAERLEELIAEP